MGRLRPIRVECGHYVLCANGLLNGRGPRTETPTTLGGKLPQNDKGSEIIGGLLIGIEPLLASACNALLYCRENGRPVQFVGHPAFFAPVLNDRNGSLTAGCGGKRTLRR